MVAQSPEVGVNVYVRVCVLSIGKSHVPMIPFVDVSGKGATGFPAQIGNTGVKVGTTLALTVICKVVFVLVQPATAGISYLMEAIPAEIPVITPVVALTVATLTFEDDQVPPVTVDIKVEEPPTQID